MVLDKVDRLERQMLQKESGGKTGSTSQPQNDR